MKIAGLSISHLRATKRVRRTSPWQRHNGLGSVSVDIASSEKLYSMRRVVIKKCRSWRDCHSFNRYSNFAEQIMYLLTSPKFQQFVSSGDKRRKWRMCHIGNAHACRSTSLSRVSGVDCVQIDVLLRSCWCRFFVCLFALAIVSWVSPIKFVAVIIAPPAIAFRIFLLNIETQTSHAEHSRGKKRSHSHTHT